jgi:adenylate kinase family enzyme
LIREKIQKEYKNECNAIVLDGFPRSVEQLYGYEDCEVCPTVCHFRKIAPNSYYLQHFDIVVFCDCPEKIVKERYLTRKLPGRLEDDEALFDRRYKEYKELNPEVVEYFRREGKLLEVRVFGVTEKPH